MMIKKQKINKKEKDVKKTNIEFGIFCKNGIHERRSSTMHFRNSLLQSELVQAKEVDLNKKSIIMRNSFIPTNGIRSQALFVQAKEQPNKPLRPASMTHSSIFYVKKNFQREKE